MSWQKLVLTAVLLGTFLGVASAQLRSAGNSGPTSFTVNQVVNRIIAREQEEVATIRRYNPINETYLQEMKPDKEMGVKPVHDYYFLGQALLSSDVVDDSMIRPRKGTADLLNPIAHLSAYFSPLYD